MDETPQTAAPEDPSAIAGWETIGEYPTEEEAQVIVAFLASRDIVATLDSMVIHEFPVATGGLGAVRVRVPNDFVAQARQALAGHESVALPEGAEPELVAESDATEPMGGDAGGGAEPR